MSGNRHREPEPNATAAAAACLLRGAEDDAVSGRPHARSEVNGVSVAVRLLHGAERSITL